MGSGNNSGNDVTVKLVVANTGMNSDRSFPEGTTVGEALKSLNLGGGKNVQVKLNRKTVELDQPLQPNDRISVAPRNMKAAA